MATNEGYETFIESDDVGGRYSVLTAVGLLPIATAGINIEAMMIGAAKAREELSSDKLEDNIAYQYATIRNILYAKGYTTEMLINYEPSEPNTLMNGGNNYLVNQKVKTSKVSILQVPTTQPIYIL